MNLTDIFEIDGEDDGKAQINRAVDKKIASVEGTNVIESKARAAALAFDETEHKKRLYEMRRDQLMAEIEEELDSLKSSWLEAKEISDTINKDLIEEMELADIDRIPMDDRKPIKIKVVAGRKRQITKKWLTEVYGKQKANSIWKIVPKYPDKKEIIISSRFEDEPIY